MPTGLLPWKLTSFSSALLSVVQKTCLLKSYGFFFFFHELQTFCQKPFSVHGATIMTRALGHCDLLAPSASAFLSPTPLPRVKFGTC